MIMSKSNEYIENVATYTKSCIYIRYEGVS